MCGIVFLHQSGADHATLCHKVGQSLERMAHRGPDDSGFWCASGVALGHRRLAILDLTASRQPMSDPSGRFILSYNGEAYNFHELRKRLLGKWKFQTSGDTEVVLAGLIIHGPSFLTGMEGMWALALWDNTTKTLLLARDRMGKKPLYYQATRHRFACASELPSLRLLSDEPWEEDLDSSADYMRYGFYLPGTTAYRGVLEVLPGHFLTWSPDSTPEIRPYWSLSIGGFQGTRAEARALLQEKLTSAIHRRMIADVEIGAFLSGGVDSSLIVSILAKRLDIRPKTFTIGFQEKTYDERPFARAVAETCGTDHYEDCLNGWDIERLKALVLDRVGQPFADASLLPTALVSELAARHVKVILSGDGGDELFSGYQRYQARALLRWYTRLPRPVRSNLRRVIRAIPEPMSHHSRSLLKKAHLFQDIVDRQESETPYIAPLLYSNGDLAKLVPDLWRRGHTPPTIASEAYLDDIEVMMATDAAVYLPQDILLKVDRASMTHSLETRAPFLDREVVEFAFSLPQNWHRGIFSGKRLLREAFGHLLPLDTWKRRKQGFSVPLGQWFASTLGNELEQLLADTSTPVAQSEAMRMLREHQEHKRDHGTRLWQLYIYITWASRSYSGFDRPA